MIREQDPHMDNLLCQMNEETQEKNLSQDLVMISKINSNVKHQLLIGVIVKKTKVFMQQFT